MESKSKNFKNKLFRMIAKSPKLEKFVDQAGHYMKNPDEFNQKVVELYNRATNKNESHPLSHFAGKTKSLYRMVKMSMSGEYKGIPKGHLYLGLAAFVYLISPWDLLPDNIPVIGLIDDAAVLIWLIKNAADEVEKFEQWEQGYQIRTVKSAY